MGLTGVGAAESDPRGDTNLLEDYLVRLVAASNIGGLVCCVGVVFRGRQHRPPVPLGGGGGKGDPGIVGAANNSAFSVWLGDRCGAYFLVVAVLIRNGGRSCYCAAPRSAVPGLAGALAMAGDECGL